MHLCEECMIKFNQKIEHTKEKFTRAMCETCFTIKTCYVIDGRYIIAIIKRKEK